VPRSPKQPSLSASAPSTTVIGVACGAGAALCWAAGFVAAQHGIRIGLSPADIIFHRYIWAGIGLFPLIARAGLRDFGGIGWTRSIALTVFGGPMLSAFSYAGFLLVPLAHGGVIQPSTAALGGLLLSTLVLKERPPIGRVLGAGAIIVGLCVIGTDALATIGAPGLLGDLSFVAAGLCFALFALLLRLWRITPIQSVSIVSVMSLGYVPVYWLLTGFESMAAVGWGENLLQAVLQGALVGVVSTYLFTQAVVLLGAARAAVFPSLVPPFTLLIGFLALGEVPSALQLVGLAVVAVGFRLTQKG
jgi:drug/metabolite transporter (DMT)-like permease